MVFPSSSATAITIRSMHLAAGGESSAAQDKMKALSLAFAFALTLRVLSQYATGLLWVCATSVILSDSKLMFFQDLHPWTWIYVLGNHNSTAIAIESWGWFIELSPAFVGSGILVGLNVSLSYLFGSFLSWYALQPITFNFQ